MKRFERVGYPILFVFFVLLFFAPLVTQGKLPIPADTIIGLYHPFRDLYATDYPNGIPYKNYLITDPVRQQFPWRHLAVEQLINGQVPLWNPYTFAGTPLLGSFQSAAFYPLNILFFFFPFTFSWSLLILLQPVLAGLFMYLYLRNLQLHRLASLLGSVTFAFSGSMIAWLEWGTLGHVIAWLPLLLLSIDKLELSNDKLRRRSTLLWSVMYLFSLTSSFFAGHLQIFFYSYLFSLVYFLVRWMQQKKNKKKLFFFIMLNSLFVILTFIQWFPTMQFISQSAREIDQMNWWEIEGWFIPWQHLIQFVAPDFFGNPTTLNYWGTWNYGELVGYVGIVPLLFALFALFFRYDRKTFFVGSVFFVSLIFALPTVFAKLPFLLDIPFLSTSQPTRLLVIADFCLAVLAAFGLDSFLRLSKERKLILYPLSFLGVIFFLLWFYVLVAPFSWGVQEEEIAIAKRNLFFPTALFIGSMITLISMLFFRKYIKIHFGLLIILMLITFFDLLRFAQKFTPFTSSEYLFPQTNIISYLQKQQGQFRIMTTDDRILPPNFSVMYQLQSLDGYDPLYLRRYGELMAAVGRGKPDISPPFGFNRIISPHQADSRLIDLLGVRYILSISDLPKERFTKVMTEGETKLYENPRAFPRSFFVEEVIAVESKEQAIQALFTKEENLKKVAIVEEWDIPQSSFSAGTVTLAAYDPDLIRLTTQTKEEAFLVLMDAYYPTWHAYVCSPDEKECEETHVYRTNYHFRGIIVPAGEKSIIFSQSLL